MEQDGGITDRQAMEREILVAHFNKSMRAFNPKTEKVVT